MLWIWLLCVFVRLGWEWVSTAVISAVTSHTLLTTLNNSSMIVTLWIIHSLFITHVLEFDTVGGIRKSIRPVTNWVMRYWRGYLSGVRCKWFAYGPADATATPLSLASLIFELVNPFWCRLTQVVLEKRPLNWCLVCWNYCYVLILKPKRPSILNVIYCFFWVF